MRISSGISEINFFNKNNIKTQKTYLWPLYNGGQVNKIRSITRRTETNLSYTKPSFEDKEKLIDISLRQDQSEYNSKGLKLNNLTLIPPGSLFDAIV